ncbi:MAG: GNAT family N-acetyltransferase [Fimbriimonadaceae bacterium]|nr:GNAT family N-acetyltransferase [Fimbriimonadaceae bacterium]
MTLRSAEPTDLPRVWELILELAEYERLRPQVTGSLALLRAHFGTAFQLEVAERSGEIVGYALWFTNFSTFRTRPGLYLEDLYVSPVARGQGIGKALLQRLIGIASERGYGRVEWSVLDWNQPAIDFYRSQGAEILTDWRICRISLPEPG